jgi:hypothetical protein
MTDEDSNSQSTDGATKKALTTRNRSGTWDWIWLGLLGVVIVRLFGLVVALAVFGSYYWLKPKFGAWQAIGLGAVIGGVVAAGLLALTQ